MATKTMDLPATRQLPGGRLWTRKESGVPGYDSGEFSILIATGGRPVVEDESGGGQRLTLPFVENDAEAGVCDSKYGLCE